MRAATRVAECLVYNLRFIWKFRLCPVLGSGGWTLCYRHSKLSQQSLITTHCCVPWQRWDIVVCGNFWALVTIFCLFAIIRLTMDGDKEPVSLLVFVQRLQSKEIFKCCLCLQVMTFNFQLPCRNTFW
jgi:hypothetical protein